jgi:hypothetical protein
MSATLENSIPLTPDEQRQARRPRVLLTGRLVYGPDFLTLDCVIRDLTPEGARVKLAGSSVISDPLVLIEVNSGLAHQCEISWKRFPEIGVRFMRTDDLSKSTDPELARLRQMWQGARSR